MSGMSAGGDKLVITGSQFEALFPVLEERARQYPFLLEEEVQLAKAIGSQITEDGVDAETFAAIAASAGANEANKYPSTAPDERERFGNWTSLADSVSHHILQLGRYAAGREFGVAATAAYEHYLALVAKMDVADH